MAVTYSFIFHEVSDSPHLIQSKHHFGYKLLLYASKGATPRCIAKIASAHFVPGKGWVSRINISKFCYYLVRGATLSSKSQHGFPVLFLRLLLQLMERSYSAFLSRSQSPKRKSRSAKTKIRSRSPLIRL